MLFDVHQNFAYSTVASAPSPATSGTSLVVAAGEGAKFPAVPFNATIWPVSVQPLSTNAEIVRVTARSTDTLTIVRAQEGSSARTVVVGDQIAATITAKTVTDIESVIPSFPRSTFWQTSTLCNPGPPSGAAFPIISRAYCCPFVAPGSKGITAVAINNTAAANAGNVHRVGVFADGGSNAPGALIEQGTVAADSTGIKTLTLSATAAVSGLFWIAVGPQGSGTVGSIWMTNMHQHAFSPNDNGSTWTGTDIGSLATYFSAAGAFSSSPVMTWEQSGLRVPYAAVRWA